MSISDNYNYGVLQLDENVEEGCDAESDVPKTTETSTASNSIYSVPIYSDILSTTEDCITLTHTPRSESPMRNTEKTCCMDQLMQVNDNDLSDRDMDTNVLSDTVSDHISFNVRAENITDITTEHGISLDDLSVEPTDSSENPPDDTHVMNSDADTVSSDNTHLHDIVDESSSMNRVLAWDPWASLNIMKNDTTPTSPVAENAHDPHIANDALHPVIVEHTTETTPVTSILKGSPRRVSSAAGGSTCNSGDGNRFELLPIGDTVVDKHVQWRHEVEVTYYTVDNEGRIVLTTEVEPLHEESEQQARSLQFARSGAKSLNMVPILEDWLPELNLNK